MTIKKNSLGLKATTALSAVILGSTIVPQSVKADEVVTIKATTGIKSKDDKKGVVVSHLKENRIAQIDTLFIKKKVETVEVESLEIDELKTKQQEINNKLAEAEAILSKSEEIVTKKAIETTVAKNLLENKKEEFTQATEKLETLQNTSSTAINILTGNSEAILTSTPKELVEVAEVKEELSKTEERVVKAINEKITNEVKTKETLLEVEYLKAEKENIDNAIQVKEEEIRKAEEEARKEKEAEERRIARQNMNFNQSAIAIAPYTFGEWVSHTERIKETVFEAPSIQSTQIGYAGNAYALGQCTWYVYNRMIETGRYIDPFLGNAGQWNENAIAKGYTVTSTPTVGSAVVFEAFYGGSAEFGHVGFVEQVYPDGSFLISEMNVGGPYTMAWRILTPNEGTSFVVPQ